MGLRFQRRIKIFPGVYINLSKSGISASVGGKGATVNMGTTGRRIVTLGVPGTGLSYRMPLSSTIVVGILAVIAIVGVVYLVQPTLVKTALHWWQPNWF